MFKIELDKKDYISENSVFERVACRGLIKINGEYLLIHSLLNGEYKFPGGGSRKNEPLIETLKREVLEETGYYIKLHTVKLVGIVLEKRKGTTHDVLKMTSYYYSCEVEDEHTKQHLAPYEKTRKYVVEITSIEKAYACNLKLTDDDLYPWNKRELLVMKRIIDNNLQI